MEYILEKLNFLKDLKIEENLDNLLIGFLIIILLNEGGEDSANIILILILLLIS
jgi:hypothetical protein